MSGCCRLMMCDIVLCPLDDLEPVRRQVKISCGLQHQRWLAVAVLLIAPFAQLLSYLFFVLFGPI